MPDAPSARILIVDDEVAQMRALCDTLGDHGYETVGFSSGKVALAELEKRKFDLLLADLMMPELDGITLLKVALQLDPDLVGIIMTGQGTIDTAVQAMKTGALDYILKPFKLSVILPVISRTLTLQQLRKDKATLERRVKERTVELETANKELEAFSYSVSHDLRAPLRHIEGYADLLAQNLSSTVSPEARRLLRIVIDSAQRMDELIEGLLRFSRLGRQALTRQPIDISSLVREVLAELNKDQGDHKVEIKVGNLPACVGDAPLVKQVFVNLLSNAFKFTRQKEPAIIEIGSEQREGERAYLIRDNGAGFDMTYADKLFGVFQRLHRDSEFEGTGVGLSIVQRIIERHGGRIWAEAEVDKGATFCFTLPQQPMERLSF